MRVAVVGATGNAGTAVLSALQERPEVDSVVGIARRLPDPAAAPYDGAYWESIDVGAAIAPKEARAQLERAFDGVDAVIHLAWLIQPNSRRDLLRRVNVEGTSTVAQAAAAAGVRSLVVASSVGAYASSPGPETRDESWPLGGVPTSHYSVDKVAQEAVLDAFEAEHPDVAVARIRPSLKFSRTAASEIQRYFLGSWVPVQALRGGRLPALPLPSGLRIQAIHSADAGAAYAAAAVQGARGAFNICADDVLGVRELADIIDHGRAVEIPPLMVRAAVSAAHRSGAITADAGWIDMAMNVPLMDTSRAREELEWQPRHTAAEALAQLLDGMVDGAGGHSVPLRPRDAGMAPLPVEPARSETDFAAAGAAAAGGGDAAAAGEATGGTRRARVRPGDGAAAGVSPRISRDLLNLYLSDHLTGASAGLSRIERMADDFVDSPVFATLSELAEEIRAERRFLKQLIHDLGFRQLRHRQVVAWAGEHVGRLKNNGRLVSRSPMTMVLEAELMRGAVMGKRGVWLTLADNAEDLGLEAEVFTELAELAARQGEALEDVHAYARRRAFRSDEETLAPRD